MASYEKKSYLNKQRNYFKMLESGCPARPPAFMTILEEKKSKQGENLTTRSKGRDDDYECDDTVDLKALSTRESYPCVTCSLTFKSKRLCAIHMKSCNPSDRFGLAPVAEAVSTQMVTTLPVSSNLSKIGSLKHRVLGSWRERTIDADLMPATSINNGSRAETIARINQSITPQVQSQWTMNSKFSAASSSCLNQHPSIPTNSSTQNIFGNQSPFQGTFSPSSPSTPLDGNQNQYCFTPDQSISADEIQRQIQPRGGEDFSQTSSCVSAPSDNQNRHPLPSLDRSISTDFFGTSHEPEDNDLMASHGPVNLSQTISNISVTSNGNQIQHPLGSIHQNVSGSLLQSQGQSCGGRDNNVFMSSQASVNFSETSSNLSAACSSVSSNIYQIQQPLAPSQRKQHLVGSQNQSPSLLSCLNAGSFSQTSSFSPAFSSAPLNVEVRHLEVTTDQSVQNSLQSAQSVVQNSNNPSAPCSSASSNGSQTRRPLATIQIRETRFHVVGASEPQELLPNAREPNFVSALNTESRINRLMDDAMSSLKYKYNLKFIIQQAPKGPVALEKLEKCGLIFGVNRNIVVNALVNFLFKSVSSKALVSTVMRECMAIQVVNEWPNMKMKLYTQQDRPWHHWYNADLNTGYLENATQVRQRTSKRPGSDNIRRTRNPTGVKKPRKLAQAPVDDENHDESDPEDYIKDVSEIKKLVGRQDQKISVLQLMSQTHERRRSKIVVKQVDTFKILNDFPHFVHYHGEVILQEFNLIYEQKESNFARIFVNDFVPKLVLIAERDPAKFEKCSPSSYDVINAFMILAKMLPTPIKTHVHETKMRQQANLLDFFNIIPVGSDPVNYHHQRQEQSEFSIQPHILAVGTQRKIQKMWLVVDGKFMEFHTSATPATAIDILLKSFYVFHLHYPLGWKNVFRFIQIHVFLIPAEKKLSQFTEAHQILTSFRPQ